MGDEVLQKGIPGSDSGWENVEIELMWSLLNCIYFVSPLMFVYQPCKYKFLEGCEQQFLSVALEAVVSKSGALCLLYPLLFPSNWRCQGVQVNASSRGSVSECLRFFSQMVLFGIPSQKSACHFQKTCLLVVYFCMCKTRKGHVNSHVFCLQAKLHTHSQAGGEKVWYYFSCMIEGIVL